MGSSFQVGHLGVVQAGGDQQDAVRPHGARLHTWYSSTMKSLRSTGSVQAARACCR
jgi:hypothetical protein